MRTDDEPLEPASQDGWVQDMLDASWREQMSSARTLMQSLRRVVPEMAAHLPESGYVKLEGALASTERAYAALHQAGPHIIGTRDYKAYLESQTERERLADDQELDRRRRQCNLL